MKRTLLIATLLSTLAIPAFAQEAPVAATPADASAAAVAEPVVVIDPVMEQVKSLQDEWAHIKYQLSSDKDAQLAALAKLESKAATVTAAYPNRPEPKIWQGIILSTDAGIVKGLSALGKVKEAKSLFEASIKQDPKALDGSAHTSLGSLYYQVPSWPVAFGDDEKAEQHLKHALAINPQSIDANYFYGDFLLQENRAAEAKAYLERALQAPDRQGRELADAGRRQEIKAALSKMGEATTTPSRPRHNQSANNP